MIKLEIIEIQSVTTAQNFLEDHILALFDQIKKDVLLN